MSLLFLDNQEQDAVLAQRIFDRQFREDGRLATELNASQRRAMLQDVMYNLRLLRTALGHDGEAIMIDYARWIYGLLRHRMKDTSPERVAELMIHHYSIVEKAVQAEWSSEHHERISQLLSAAVKVTTEASQEPAFPEEEEAPYKELRERYIELVLAAKRTEATDLILEAADQDIALDDIYMHVFQAAMHTVGRYWHEGKIFVDKEHYFTAMTQSIMTRLYPRIFSTPRVGRTIVAACVGHELHEMGIRMLCDLFEVHGWDSVYLGAAVPEQGIISSVQEHNPDILALSVTMAHHLEQAESIIRSLRENHVGPTTKIAVGGRAFQIAPQLAMTWGADVTAADATALLTWADENLG